MIKSTSICTYTWGTKWQRSSPPVMGLSDRLRSIHQFSSDRYRLCPKAYLYDTSCDSCHQRKGRYELTFLVVLQIECGIRQIQLNNDMLSMYILVVAAVCTLYVFLYMLHNLKLYFH